MPSCPRSWPVARTSHPSSRRVVSWLGYFMLLFSHRPSVVVGYEAPTLPQTLLASEPRGSWRGAPRFALPLPPPPPPALPPDPPQGVTGAPCDNDIMLWNAVATARSSGRIGLCYGSR